MSHKTLLTIDGVYRRIKQPLATIDHTHRKVKKVLLTEGGVHKQVWPSYTWRRYTVEEAQQYYWDKYSTNSQKRPDGVRVTSTSSGTMVIDWRYVYYDNDSEVPAYTAAHRWAGFRSTTLYGLISGYYHGGEWIVEEEDDISLPCYFVTRVEEVDDDYTQARIYYSKIAKTVYTTVYSKGSTSYGQVSAVNDDAAYPQNGRSGSYWYVYNKAETIQIKGSEVDTVFGDSLDAYPVNGIHTDGYWYVRVDE